MKRSSLSKWLAKIGAKGGRKRTEAQTKARQENGKKGGRPKTIMSSSSIKPGRGEVQSLMGIRWNWAAA
tara:strand:+ start:560 stop:766 length:207 start_codon:yes stop_codon:yes gene_type:complete